MSTSRCQRRNRNNGTESNRKRKKAKKRKEKETHVIFGKILEKLNLQKNGGTGKFKKTEKKEVSNGEKMK